MFGNKPNLKKEEISVKVQSIPHEFYGGVDPIIKFKEVEKEVKNEKSTNPLTDAELKMINKKYSAGGETDLHPANLLSSKKFLVFSCLILFTLFAVGAGIYYWLSIRPQTQDNLVVNPPKITIPTSTPKQEETIGMTNEVVAPTSTENLSLSNGNPIKFPSRLLGSSKDSDSDGLTDAEEELFGTDVEVADSDNDTYSDSHELFYLYNPAGFKPMKLIDTQKVLDYTHPIFAYQIYYPTTWLVAPVDKTNNQILFSAPNGEFIEVRVEELSQGQKFSDWFALNAPMERYADLEKFTSRFNEVGARRNDGLVYYFQDKQGRVVVMIYHALENEPISYKKIMEMMARSFRFSGNTAEISLLDNTEGRARDEVDSANLTASSTTR